MRGVELTGVEPPSFWGTVFVGRVTEIFRRFAVNFLVKLLNSAGIGAVAWLNARSCDERARRIYIKKALGRVRKGYVAGSEASNSQV